MSLGDSVNEIIPGLSQGGWPALDRSVGYDLIVNLSSVEHVPCPGQLYVRWPIEDGDPPDRRTLVGVAELVSRLVRAGRSVLVNCDAGLNRSGLVVAFTLLDLGHSADDAISLIREKRDEYALCNSGFELMVRRADS